MGTRYDWREVGGSWTSLSDNLCISLLHSRLRYMRVDLRGVQTGVAEQLLDDRDVHTGLECMRGEGVPQLVGYQTVLQPGAAADRARGFLDLAWAGQQTGCVRVALQVLDNQQLSAWRSRQSGFCCPCRSQSATAPAGRPPAAAGGPARTSGSRWTAAARVAAVRAVRCRLAGHARRCPRTGAGACAAGRVWPSGSCLRGCV